MCRNGNRKYIYLYCKFCKGGGRFCSLDQTHLECESTLVEIVSFHPRKSSEDQNKKRSLPQFETELGRNLWDLFALPDPFSYVQPVLKPRLGDAESRWGDASPHPSYNLSTGNRLRISTTGTSC